MRSRSGPRRRGFLRDRRGATAVEFAILGLPFIFALLAVAEYGFVYLVDVSLDNATVAAARRVRTGQAQTATTTDPSTGKTVNAPVSRQQFVKLVCAGFTWAGDCEGSLQVSSEVQANWSGQNDAAPLNSSGELRSDMPFEMGQPGDIVLVRAFYPWRMITPSLWGGATHRMSANRLLLSAGSILMNEPYGSDS